LERLEILGKMQGIDIFDMKPLDASRKGTAPSRHIRAYNFETLIADSGAQARSITPLLSSPSARSNMLVALVIPLIPTSRFGLQYFTH
jgi:cytochrome c oxidase subunit 5b